MTPEAESLCLRRSSTVGAKFLGDQAQIPQVTGHERATAIQEIDNPDLVLERTN